MERHKVPLYVALARKVAWQPPTAEMKQQRRDEITRLTKLLPSGSGIDSGTKLSEIASTETRLVLHVDYHHMDGNGYYEGWTNHKVVVTPSLVREFDIKVTGPDRHGIKDYLVDVYIDALSTEVEEYDYDAYEAADKAKAKPDYDLTGGDSEEGK